MRLVSRIIVSLLVVVGLAVGVGSGVAAQPGPGELVHLDGTVMDSTGTPVENGSVLIGDFAMLDKVTPAQLREVAAGEPQDVHVVSVDEDGTYSTDVEWEQADAALAITTNRISKTARLSRENTTRDFQVYPNRPQQVYGHAGAVSADEDQARLFIGLRNNDDIPIQNMSVTITSLPADWTIKSVDTAGEYQSDTQKITWSEVPAGAEIDTTVHISFPEGADVGDYTVTFTAASQTHHLDGESVTIERLPETTPGPTTTGVYGGPGGDDHSDDTPTAQSPTITGHTEPTETSQPGFTSVVSMIAIAILVLGLVRRRQD